jgi:hypothetical protein
MSKMNQKNRISECEYQSRLDSLLKGAFNTQLQPLRSLNTATKKRRAVKRPAAGSSTYTKPNTTSG